MNLKKTTTTTTTTTQKQVNTAHSAHLFADADELVRLHGEGGKGDVCSIDAQVGQLQMLLEPDRQVARHFAVFLRFGCFLSWSLALSVVLVVSAALLF